MSVTSKLQSVHTLPDGTVQLEQVSGKKLRLSAQDATKLRAALHVMPPEPTTTPHIIGLQDMTVMFAMNPASVQQWRVRGVLPDPLKVVGKSPVWQYHTIVNWALDTGREIKVHLDPPPGDGRLTTAELFRRQNAG